jgi:hypothetical protein
MKLGTNDIGSVYLVTNAVQKVYLGTNEVWSSYAYLLDDYSGAAAAYSLRLLRSAYTGDAIKVRRAVGSPSEKDIGFVNNELDVADLESFCSGTNGFVVTWYDQSGNANDATQTTAANQPQIVSSGSVILENGKPIINGLDNTDFLVIDNSISKASITSIFSVASLDTNATFYVLLADGSNTAYMVSQLNSVATTINLNVGTPTVYKNSSLYTITNRGDAYNDFQGQKLISLIGGSTNFSPLNIGYGVGVEMYNTQEIVIYNSDQSSNRTGIETNINDFYSIY